MRILTLIAAVFSAFAAATAQGDEDKYIGYYYPEVGSEELFDRKLANAPPAGKAVRVNFATAITKAQLSAPESPRFVLFSKGGDAEHLIIIGLDDDVFGTLYRARAVLAQLTSNMRGTDFFRQQKLDVAGTFFDMLQIMRFETLVISDGARWAHRVRFARN